MRLVARRSDAGAASGACISYVLSCQNVLYINGDIAQWQRVSFAFAMIRKGPGFKPRCLQILLVAGGSGSSFFVRQAGTQLFDSLQSESAIVSLHTVPTVRSDHATTRISPPSPGSTRPRMPQARQRWKKFEITQSLISEQRGKGVNTARGGRSREHLVQVAVSAVRRFRLALADNTHCEKNDTEYDKEYEKETEHAPPGLALIGMRLRQLLRGAVRIPSDRNDVGLDIV